MVQPRYFLWVGIVALSLQCSSSASVSNTGQVANGYDTSKIIALPALKRDVKAGRADIGALKIEEALGRQDAVFYPYPIHREGEHLQYPDECLSYALGWLALVCIGWHWFLSHCAPRRQLT